MCFYKEIQINIYALLLCKLYNGVDPHYNVIYESRNGERTITTHSRFNEIQHYIARGLASAGFLTSSHPFPAVTR
jgi:hypothetical protein